MADDIANAVAGGATSVAVARSDCGLENQHSHRIGLGCHHIYLLPEIYGILATQRPSKIFDLGCGDGFVANELAARGYKVNGCDPSAVGIKLAHQAYPHLDLREASAYDDLESQFGTYPVVISLEVVEHIYAPRKYASTLLEVVPLSGTVWRLG